MLQQGIEHAVRRGCARVVRHRTASPTAAAGGADDRSDDRVSTASAVQVLLKPAARECGVLQLMTRAVDRGNDAFFVLYFRLATAVGGTGGAAGTGRGAGAGSSGAGATQRGKSKGHRATILAEVLGSDAVVGGLAHNDAVLLQPVQHGEQAGVGGTGSLIGVVETQFNPVDAGAGPSAGGGALDRGMVRVKVLRRRVAGAAAAAMTGQSRWACVPLDNLTTCMRE